MSLENLRYDVARLEAKLDLLLARLDTRGTNPSDPSPQSQENQLTAGEVGLLRSLTPKQHATLQLLILGWSNRRIADLFDIGENTVKLHVRAVCKKIGCKTRGEAAMAGSAVLSRVSPQEYATLSGGLPLDWANTLDPENVDPFAHLYARRDDTSQPWNTRAQEQ